MLKRTTRLWIALSGFAGCDAEPAEVLALRDAGPGRDDAACALPSDCDASAREERDAGCSCVVGARAGCLETVDIGDAGCAAISGTKLCQADGTWTPCLGPVTVDTLRGVTCTLVYASCGPLGVFSSTSGDCSQALRCSPRSLP